MLLKFFNAFPFHYLLSLNNIYPLLKTWSNNISRWFVRTSRKDNTSIALISSGKKEYILLTSLEWVTEKAMAPHSSALAWKIPRAEEPRRLQSMGSRRVGHDWTTSLSLLFHALEKEMATHSSVLAWRIQGMAEPRATRLWSRTKSDTTAVTQQQWLSSSSRLS